MSTEELHSTSEAFWSLDWPEWYADSNCAGVDADVFFGKDKDEYTSKHAADMSDEEVARAKLFCGNCPVLEECREYALTHFWDYGVWGEMTHRERLAWWRDFGGRRLLRNLEGFHSPFDGDGEA